MRIGIIDADKSAFPNIALMKLSAYHKAVGDTVEWVNHWDRYDHVYVSKVFTNSLDPQTVINSDSIEYGGTGYSLKTTLPANIESAYPDYSLYPNCDYAIGFLTRGCSRGCPFCIVKEKEGSAHKVADISDIWRGQKSIKLLDPNLLEFSGSVELLWQLKNTNAYIDFTQGIDIRLVTDDHIDILKQMKIRRVHFAYDLMKNSDRIESGISNFMAKTGWKRGKVTVYILCNFDTTFEEDMHRIMFVKNAGATPYVMLYNKHLMQKGNIYLRMQRWCNAPQILYSTNFDNYK